MTTFDILEALQNEVGTRRAGTAGEKKAQQWLQARAEALGLPVELDEFTFIGSELYRPILNFVVMSWLIACLVLAIGGNSRDSLLGLIILFGYFTFVHDKVDVRLARTVSQNVIAGLKRPLSAYVADPAKGTAVLLCAHYDTPRNFPPFFRKIRKPMSFLSPLALLGLLLFFVVNLLNQLLLWLDAGGELWPRLAAGSGWLALVMAAPLITLAYVNSIYSFVGRKSDSPGCDDNGSGTALVLALAERLQADPPDNVDVFFAWWGAEEKGLFGSRQFVRRFHERLDKEKLHVVNADCVGVGEVLTIHTGQGVVRRKPTSPAVTGRLTEIAQKLNVPTGRSWESIISGGSSDQAGWIERGFKNAALILRADRDSLSLPARLLAILLRIPDPNQYDLDHIHTADDNLAGINPAVLASSTDVAEQYVRALDGEG